jgi:DNA-binding transcriptional LysR family regulator
VAIAVQSLRAFRAVMEVGSTNAAADRIGRTQPQLSRLISQLEDEIGFPLFDRERRRLVPTMRAHRFYQEVIRALDGLDSIKQVGEDLRLEADAQLRVIAPPYASYTVLPEALARYREIFPKGQFSLELVTRSTMGRWLSFHPFDIGIASLPFDAPAISSIPLAQVATVVVMACGHPLAAKKKIAAEDLGRYPFVALNSFTLLRRQLDRVLDDAGVKLRLVGETDTGLSACQLVAKGLGITVVDRLWVDAMPEGEVQYRQWEPGLRSSFGLIHPTATPLGPPARALADILKDIFKTRYKLHAEGQTRHSGSRPRRV